MVAALLGFGLLILVVWPIQVPYFAMSPGPVEEVADLITIDDAERFDTTGELFLLTVGLREVNLFEYVEAQLDGKIDLIERDVIRPPGVTQEQVTRTNLQAMDESIDTAVFVALSRLGYDVSFGGDGVEVLEIVEASPADGALVVGDVIKRIDGEIISTAEQASDVIRSFGVGDTIELTGDRSGEQFATSITLVEHTELPDTAMVGVLFDTVGLRIVTPVSVRVDSRNIGGPSAGMMYTLTVLDLLTVEDLTKGHRIAGTGTIRFDETIGPIGGVRQKVFAARNIGAEYMLVPEANLADALTAAGEDIEVVPILVLQDAIDFFDRLEPAPTLVAAG